MTSANSGAYFIEDIVYLYSRGSLLNLLGLWKPCFLTAIKHKDSKLNCTFISLKCKEMFCFHSTLDNTKGMC